MKWDIGLNLLPLPVWIHLRKSYSSVLIIRLIFRTEICKHYLCWLMQEGNISVSVYYIWKDRRTVCKKRIVCCFS